MVGASFDSPDENRSFRSEQCFDFALLSDGTKSVGAAYGVVRSGGPYAPFPLRYSFLIDPAGVVQRVYDVDDVARHAEVVLADLDRLTGAASDRN